MEIQSTPRLVSPNVDDPLPRLSHVAAGFKRFGRTGQVHSRGLSLSPPYPSLRLRHGRRRVRPPEGQGCGQQPGGCTGTSAPRRSDQAPRETVLRSRTHGPLPQPAVVAEASKHGAQTEGESHTPEATPRQDTDSPLGFRTRPAALGGPRCWGRPGAP